jgi:hypothetical protein
MPSIPPDICQALQDEHRELRLRFSRGDWGPAQLNGGRFAEALLRYLEWKESRTFTPIGTQLRRSAILGKVRSNAGIPDGLRFHVASCVELLMDVRNKRDVAHLGNVVDVKAMDAHLVMRLASWSLAEVIREESQLAPDEIQALIDRLSERRLALVEEIDGRLIVVATELPAAHRALVALYHCHPEALGIAELREAVQYSNASRFRHILQKKVSEAIVFISGETCRLTSKGAQWVERHIELRLVV